MKVPAYMRLRPCTRSGGPRAEHLRTSGTQSVSCGYMYFSGTCTLDRDAGAGVRCTQIEYIEYIEYIERVERSQLNGARTSATMAFMDATPRFIARFGLRLRT